MSAKDKKEEQEYLNRNREEILGELLGRQPHNRQIPKVMIIRDLKDLLKGIPLGPEDVKEFIDIIKSRGVSKACHRCAKLTYEGDMTSGIIMPALCQYCAGFVDAS